MPHHNFFNGAMAQRTGPAPSCRRAAISLLAASLALSACTTPIAPAEVTRFHAVPDQKLAAGIVDIVPFETANADSLEHKSYAAAVAAELRKLGLTQNVPGTTAGASVYEAKLRVKRTVIPVGRDGNPVSVGVGGSTGSFGSGVGLGIGIDLSGKPKDIVLTELSVRLSRRADTKVLWEGRASTEAKEGSPAAQPGIAAAKLASALFEGFPGQSGETIRVK